MSFSVSLPGDHKQWTIGGLKAYDGPEKKHSFVWWAGIANVGVGKRVCASIWLFRQHFWFINQELGWVRRRGVALLAHHNYRVCAMIQTQIFPFNDLSVISLVSAILPTTPSLITCPSFSDNYNLSFKKFNDFCSLTTHSIRFFSIDWYVKVKLFSRICVTDAKNWLSYFVKKWRVTNKIM